MNRRHRYAAHLQSEGPHARQWIAEADSFIDAAVRFAETAHADHGELSIEVMDCESGKHRCFLVNLETGDVSSC